MRFLLLRPELATRDCALCLKYAHDEDGPQLYRGKLRRRLPRELAACRTPRGCPKGTPENPRTLTPANWLCYNHYLRCRATGIWPADPLVQYHARILSAIEREAWEAKQIAQLQSLFGNSAPMP